MNSITSKFSELRADNLENLQKTDRRLSILKADPMNPTIKDEVLSPGKVEIDDGMGVLIYKQHYYKLYFDNTSM